MTNNQHGQVPEALIDLIDAYAETRHRCGGIYNARTEAARKAVIEALSGVQALSAAPAGFVPVAAFDRLHAHAESLAARLLAAEQQAPKAAPGESFQNRVQPWLLQCFGAEISADTVERNHRFLEEALELVQSTGCTQSEAHQLVDYVFGRPVGEPDQEVGGVMVTLAALCLANGLDMHNAGEIELARIWTKVEAIRAKQAAKPKHSPLPQAAPQPAPAPLSDDVVKDAARYRFLAGHCRSTSEHWGGRWSIVVDGPAPKSHDSEDDFDEAVDAALAAQGGKV